MQTGYRTRRPRRGAAIIEVAFVAPVAILLTLGIIVAGFGVFRQQQVAALAREGARWASIRGHEYCKQTGAAVPTADQVFQAAVQPKCVGLAANALKPKLEWGTNRRTVRFTLDYDWIPESFLKPMTFSATSEMPVAN